MSEKYGFVYIWRDRKHNRYYIGSHWGTEDDGYICSSRWMRKSYKRRKEDFKRKILSRIYTNRYDLLDEEQRWFNYIKPEEFRTKYYNINSKVLPHWSMTENSRLTIGEKIANAWTDERREAQSKRMLENNPNNKEGVIKKRLQTIEKNGGLVAWNKGIPQPEEVKKKRLQTIEKNGGHKSPPNKGIPLSEEQKNKISSTWIVTHPDGKEEVVINLNKFCEQHGLTDSLLRKVAYGKRNHHRGYSAVKYDK